MLPEQKPPPDLTPLHATEDALELYSLHLLRGNELDALEEHLLVCSLCRRNLEEVDATIGVLREGLKTFELKERSTALRQKQESGNIVLFRYLN